MRRHDVVPLAPLAFANPIQGSTVVLEMKYYTYAEVAQILRCSERTVHNRVRNGDIKPLRNGRLVLFTQQCIEEFLQRNSKTSNTQTLN